MHSPFVFDFILNVLNNRSGYFPPGQIEELRRQLLSDNRLINGSDMGAGSRSAAIKKRVSHIARTALKPKKYARMLYRLVKHYHPRTILELGTSLGLTTSYLHYGNPAARLITIEGNTGIAEKARENFEKLDISGIESITGNFDDVLFQQLNNIGMIDLAFVDGNHRLKPTIHYFQQLLEHIHSGSILVFDDIHWSSEMEEAWKQICEHPQVCYTIDIFFLGFVFFRNEFKVKQNFVVRF
jgi:predicted O-methyltransferase YrrM